MKTFLMKTFAAMFASLIFAMNATSLPAAVLVSDSAWNQDGDALSHTLFSENIAFNTSMQAYLNLESLISMSVCYRFENMEDIEPENYVDRVGLLVWNAENAPEEDEATYDNCSDIIEGAYYNAVLDRFETETKGIVAKKLGDGLTFRAYYRDSDGNYVYSRIIENYSPKAYCYNQISKNADDEATCELMRSILNYGAAAQKYFGYKTDDLVNKELTEEKEVLVFSLLDEGTYGVMAGPDAATQASIVIPETYLGIDVTEILTTGFSGLNVLQSVTVPSTVIKIGDEAFKGCKYLEKIELSDGLQVIGSNAFYGCTSLNAVYLPDSLTTIEENSFRNCSSMTSITIPASVNYIGSYAFYGTSLNSATLSDSSGWMLENGAIKVSSPSVIFEYVSFNNHVLYDYGTNYREEYVGTLDLSLPGTVAKALAATSTITVQRVYTQYFPATGNTNVSKTDYGAAYANFYTENWIKR